VNDLKGVMTVDARVRLPMERRPATSTVKPIEYTEDYDRVLATDRSRFRSKEELVNDMENAGIAKAIVHAEYEHGDFADELNLAVAQFVSSQPLLFWGVGTVSLAEAQPMRIVRQAETIKQSGLIGINIQPAFFGLAIDDARLFPLFSTASDLGLVVSIHTGINYTRHKPMDLERPEMLDRVACNFPDLRLVACHAAWPWVDTLCAVMRRHRNVYADFGGLAPRYIGENGTGWATLRRLMDGPLSEQILFATDWPVFPMDRAVREWEAIGLKPETLRNLMEKNSSRLYFEGKNE